jgi:hypothetical protein
MVGETGMSYRARLKVGPLLSSGEMVEIPMWTVPANPLSLVTVTVNLDDEPGSMVVLAGVTLRPKSPLEA